MAERLMIGQVAAQAGVNIQTLRYYERQGILPKAKRSASGYREYSPETVKIVRFIKRAQELGFTLAEIQELLRLRQARTRPGGPVLALAEEKIRDIEEKIRNLTAIRSALTKLAASCRCAGGEIECPILEALTEDDRPEHGEGNAGFKLEVLS
jgi:MerR family copper efflux transcriptional regulator